ncbi:MAG: HlyD family efflux transporter periplasmic adaptor subunit [Prevotella sp.]|nr:HlyD family efflux transporter periplasmic adaptor subunit [Prevotella sp.]
MSAKSQHQNILLAILGTILVVATVAIIGHFTLGKSQETIQGEVEVTEYRVSSKIPGRILEIRVNEGDFVHAGDTLAILEANELDAKKAQAESARNAAAAVNEMADNGAREETIRAAYELLQQARAANDLANETYQRVNNLYEEGVLTAQKRDEALAAVKATDAQVKAAQSQYDMARNGARMEERKATAAQVAQAKGAIQEVNAYIRETVQVAQMDGEVTEIFPRIGELVGSGAPIMNVAIMTDMWGVFNVREDLLNDMKVGDEFMAFAPAFNKDIKMKVYAMKDLGSYSTWKATKTTGQYDLKTFEVKARPVEKLDGLRPGMSLIIKK